MTTLHRAAFVPLLCKLGSCIEKPQWATRRIPSFKAYFRLILLSRYFPKYFLGGPTTEGSCHITGQPSAELAKLVTLSLCSLPWSCTWGSGLPFSPKSEDGGEGRGLCVSTITHYVQKTNQVLSLSLPANLQQLPNAVPPADAPQKGGETGCQMWYPHSALDRRHAF